MVLAAFGAAGCHPARFVARRFAQAPNTYPQWFAPDARVVLGYHDSLITNFPLQRITVTNPPARLAIRRVPPAAYGLQMTTTNWSVRGRELARFDFHATVPAPPWPGPPRGTVFLLHGYGLDLETMVPWALWLGERGWVSILVDLRGHGHSTGRQIGFGPLEASDLDQLLIGLRERGEVPGPVMALGVSYGAALSLRWAAQNPAVTSVVAIAPYAELAPTVDRLRSDYVPWLPHWMVSRGVREIPGVVGSPAAELDTITVVGRRSVPALLIAGGADVIAPVAEVERLRKRAGNGSRIEVILDANHEALPFRFRELSEAVDAWLQR